MVLSVCSLMVHLGPSMPALICLGDILSTESLRGVPSSRGNPFEVDNDVESSVSPSSIDWERFIDFSLDGLSGMVYSGSPL